ncbi:MAG: hypothetical protein JNM88_05030 [Chitinophagaceae bacterium]|nr:hypothetical protein [Chitinophagaceae bacterium]
MGRFIFLLVCCAVLASCNNGKKKEAPAVPVTPPDSLVNPVQVDDPARDSVLLAQTKEILTAFKKKNYDSLALFIHPAAGVRFSPYGFIDTVNDKLISAAMVKSWADKAKRTNILWGTEDPTDDPINLNIDQYVKRYVYDVDFVKADSVKVNAFIGSGNTINNLAEVYKGCNFVESHFPGFEKKYEGMDWRSLRLVFRLIDGKYYLVGVVHDEWST